MPLYPAIEAYHSELLPVSPLHTLYVEQVGNPNGLPIVFLHGGPGGSVAPNNRQYFDPAKWNVTLFDQRGCGKSTPHASLEANTTWDLVEDLERIREHLGFESWYVFGGSWGSTLALAYAIKHPTRVRGLILRGIFLTRPWEIQWFYQSGASNLFPDLWEPYKNAIPESERHDFVTAYYKRLTSSNRAEVLAAAKAWSIWEGSTSKLRLDPAIVAQFSTDDFADAFARIECHYFINNAFFPSDNWILENADKIAHIKTTIIHGRYDVVCPVRNAFELHQAMPASSLQIIPDAGHAASEPGIMEALVAATDEFARHG